MLRTLIHLRSFTLQCVLVCLLLCPVANTLLAQDATVKKMLKEANAYYDAFAYEQAIPIYRDILLRDNLFEAKIKLAEAYRFINDFEKSEYWYRQIIGQLPADQPVHKLHFAQVLQSNGNCDEAKKWFVEYGRYDALGTQLAKGCDMIDQLNEHAYDYEVWLLPANTKFAEFAPVMFNNGLVFCSNRQDIMKGKSKKNKGGSDKQYLDLYYTERQPGNAFTPPQKLKGAINSQFNDGPITFSTHIDTTDQLFKDTLAIFTRNAFYKGKKQRSDEGVLLLSLYTAHYQSGGKWGNVSKFTYNNIEDELDKVRTYSMTHPALSADGQNLFFVSDMEGGYGGTDIYLCTRIDSTWSRPVNLGPQVNTAGSELFPYMHPDGTLYFTSNGHPGLGGLDIFYTRYARNTWQNPTNLGAPFNSNRDDFGLAMSGDKTWGYFTSNRPGGFGSDDIYYFAEMPQEMESTGLGNAKNTSVAFEQPNIVNTLINDAIGMNKVRFKPGDWTIGPDAEKELNKLAQYLNEWPEIRVEVGAHTDARGNDFVNLEVSQNRADAVRDYLLLNGIAPARVISKGYGESMLLNHCVNGMECSNELHEQNNRVEVKAIFIQGLSNTSVAQTTTQVIPPVQPSSTEPELILEPVGQEALTAGEGLTYKIFLGPFRNVDNDTYYNFAELNTGIDLLYAPEGMMIILGPYNTITEAEEYEQHAKERGAKKTKIEIFKGTEKSEMTLKQLKKMGVK